MSKRTLLIVLMVVAVMLTGISINAQDDDLENLRFSLTFIPNIQFSPVYVAIEKGYAADAGFNLEIDYIDENLIVDLVAANDLQFGVVSGEQVVLARNGRRPVVYVYEWFQQFPVGILIPNTTDATTVTDLEDHPVGVPGRFGASYIGLTALLASNDMTETDIRLEPIGFIAPDAICAGQVDATMVYVNNEPLQIQQRADAGECGNISSVSVIPVTSEVDIVANGILTNEETIEDNPELVQTIVTMFDRGLRDSINNPAEAYLLSASYVDNLPLDDDFRTALEDASEAQIEFLATNPDREAIAQSRVDLYDSLRAQFDANTLIQFQVLLATIDLWDAEQLGYTDPASWEATQELLITMESLPNELDLEDAYTNQFVPDAQED